MEENEVQSGVVVPDPEEAAAENEVNSTELIAEVVAIGGKLDNISGEMAAIKSQLISCYSMLIIMAVLALRGVFKEIIRKSRGGHDNV